MGKTGPKHQEHNQHGSDKKPFGAREDKGALLARMKAAQSDKAPAEIEGQPLDRPNDGAGKTATDERGGKAVRGHEDLSKD